MLICMIGKQGIGLACFQNNDGAHSQQRGSYVQEQRAPNGIVYNGNPYVVLVPSIMYNDAHSQVAGYMVRSSAHDLCAQPNSWAPTT